MLRRNLRRHRRNRDVVLSEDVMKALYNEHVSFDIHINTIYINHCVWCNIVAEHQAEIQSTSQIPRPREG